MNEVYKQETWPVQNCTPRHDQNFFMQKYGFEISSFHGQTFFFSEKKLKLDLPLFAL